MPVLSDWILAADGLWTDPTRWNAGVPIAPGDFAFFTLGSALAIDVAFTEGTTAEIGGLVIDLGDTSALTFQGSSADSGAGFAQLVFDSGDLSSPALLSVNATTDSFLTFNSTNGLRMRLDSTLIVSAPTAPNFSISFALPVSGVGMLRKQGTGTLNLFDANTFSGGLSIENGTLRAQSDASLGSGAISISNNAALWTLAATTVDNTIGTQIGTTGTAGSAKIIAANGTTATYTGTLNHVSQGTITFGAPSGTGIIIASFSTINENATNSTFTIAGGQLRFDDAYNAQNLFFHPGAGTTAIENGATLDTRGFVTRISNLDMNGGTLTATSGALNVALYTQPTTNIQTGTILGTAGADLIVVNVATHFSMAGVTVNNWTSGTDQIELNGSAAVNEITGSAAGEIIRGFGGNDLLISGGGGDRLEGGDGDDGLNLSGDFSGSIIDGGNGVDVMRVIGAGSVVSIAGVERITFIAAGSRLVLSNAQFSTLTASAIEFNGTGEFYVNMAAGDLFLASQANILAGSTLRFQVNGSTGIDVIKSHLDATNLIFGFAGSDQIRGGNLVDTITGDEGNDKIMGLAGADSLTGGIGADQFRYLFGNDSLTGTGADRILDFLAGTDKLDFRTLDANPLLAGRQALTYIGTSAFANTGTAQARWTDLGADLRVEVDLDGNGTADMHILLVGAGTQVLSSTDFLL